MENARKLYHGMTPYRFSFINPEWGTHRVYWVRFYRDMEVALSDSKRVALRECPKAHSFMIESDQDSKEIRKSWGLPH